MEDDFFWTWTTQYDTEDNLYYVRLEKMELGTCNTLFQLDYGRFKDYQEAMDFIATLPEPEEAAENEAKVFNCG